MQDRPGAKELVRAVKEHIEREVLPALSNPKLRYQTLVAAHVLSVVAREIELGESTARAELESLRALQPGGAELPTLAEVDAELLVQNRALAAAIRAGTAGESVALRAHLRRATLAKLSIANPTYESLGGGGTRPPRRATSSR